MNSAASNRRCAFHSRVDYFREIRRVDSVWSVSWRLTEKSPQNQWAILFVGSPLTAEQEICVEHGLAYNEARGNADWSAAGVTDALRTAALVRASSALDGIYGDRFAGRKTGGRSQALAWPRTGAYDHCAGEDISSDEIPQEVVNAAYELALAELQAPGSSSPTVTPGRLVNRLASAGLFHAQEQPQ